MRRFGLAVGVAVLALAAVLAVQRGRTEAEYRRLIAAGDAALAGGRIYPAIEAFSGALALRPNSMVAYLRRGEAYQRQESLDTAARDLAMAAQLDPNATQPLERLGEVSMARHDFARAADWYAQAADRDTTSASLAYRSGYNRYRSGDVARAIEPLRRAVARAPDAGEMHYALGLALRDTGDTAGARASLERAVQLAPALMPAREALADLLRQAGDAPEHLRQLEALAGLDSSVERHVAVALAAADAGRTDRAVLALGAANDLGSSDPRIPIALGRVWLADAEVKGDRSSLRKAAEALGATTTAAPTSETLALHGRLAFLTGQIAEANRLLERAVAMRPVWPEALRYQAEALRAARRAEEADAALARYDALTGLRK